MFFADPTKNKHFALNARRWLSIGLLCLLLWLPSLRAQEVEDNFNEFELMQELIRLNNEGREAAARDREDGDRDLPVDDEMELFSEILGVDDEDESDEDDEEFEDEDDEDDDLEDDEEEELDDEEDEEEDFEEDEEEFEEDEEEFEDDEEEFEDEEDEFDDEEEEFDEDEFEEDEDDDEFDDDED